MVRSHPLGVGDYDAGPALSSRVRLLDVTVLNEVNPVLSAVDHLVTDYSSMAFDFALTGGTIVFLAADVTSYLDSRGLYEPYHEFTGGRHVATWAHALQRLDALVAGDPETTASAREHTRWLRDEHFDHLDGRAGERVLDAILERIGSAAPAPAPAAWPATERPERPDRPTVTSVAVEPDRLVLGLQGRRDSSRGDRLGRAAGPGRGGAHRRRCRGPAARVPLG